MSVCFCCKQKTAYEMRISDWSSDVCSSDLRAAQARSDFTLRGGEEDLSAQCLRIFCQMALGHDLAHPAVLLWHAMAGVGRAPGVAVRSGSTAFLDRKSVVSGKGVSVRVDLGGCRFINKKK